MDEMEKCDTITFRCLIITCVGISGGNTVSFLWGSTKLHIFVFYVFRFV